MKIKILLIVFCFLTLTASAQSAYLTEVNALMDKADEEMSKHHLPQYLKIAHQLLRLAQENRDTSAMVQRCIRLVDFYTFFDRNDDSSMFYRNKGIFWAHKINDKESKADFDFMLAALYVEDGKYVEAYKMYQKLEVDVAKNDFGFAPFFNYSYSKLLFQLKEYRKGISKLKLAAQTFESWHANEDAAAMYSNIGVQYAALKQFDSAMLYHSRSLKVATANQDTFRMAEYNNKIGSLYKIKGDLKMALHYFKISFELNHTDPSDNLLTNYTEVLQKEGKVGEAESILRHLIKESKVPQTILDAIRALILIKKNDNKLEEALSLSEEYNEKQQQLLSVEKVKQIEELRTQYNVSQKETEIEKLHDRNAAQAVTLKKNNIIVFTSTVLFLAVLIALFLVYRNRAIRLQAEQILLEQQLLRSQMNPHFIFNSLSVIQSTVLQKEHLKAAGYIATFSKLVRNILENSTQSWVTFDSELSALKDYLALQKIRFQERLNYSIQMDESMEPDLISIPPMLFQPSVENALEHGISNTSNGHIDISFKQFDKFVRCTVIDNGVGYGNSVKQEDGKQSLSTEIIKKRLAIFSKQMKRDLNYHINPIKNDQGEIVGTKVEIDIPVFS